MGRNRRLLFVVEYALENTTLDVIVYQGQLDLICDIVGTLRYIHGDSFTSGTKDMDHVKLSD